MSHWRTVSRSIPLRASFVAAVAAAIPTVALAIPTPVPHTHTAATVPWKQPGSPALPWTDAVSDSWNHQHLTADPFNNSPKWVINKAWDNRTLHNSLGGNPQFGHGLIQASTPVRYQFAAAMPTDAKNVVEAGYNLWMAAANVQFSGNQTLDDIFAMNFVRQNTGATDLNINFTANQAVNGYGEFDGVNTITFVAAPTITLEAPVSAGNVKRISIGNPGNGNAGNLSIVEQTPWTYDGTPALNHTDDLWYSNNSGATWTDTAPGGFGAIDWNFGSLTATDKIDIFEMDFTTIALHEIGHSIALGHTGNGSGNIMETDIANLAHFGRTLGIDDDSALAAAIDYTYSLVPEPGSATAVMLIAIVGLKRRGRRSVAA